MLTIIAFIFVLSLLVLIHEFGHFAVAKLSGIGVLRFSIGYPPRLFGVKIGETDYCVSAIPFGGYVAMVGQSDFGDDGEHTDDPRDYRTKPTLVKMAVLFAGSFMNILAAVVIFSLLFWSQGVPQETTRVGRVVDGSPAAEAGLRVGDDVIAVDGKTVSRIEDALLPLYMDGGGTLTVMRNGTPVELTITRQLGQSEDFGVMPYYEARVSSLAEGAPAAEAGILPGDVIARIDSMQVEGWYHMSRIVEANPGASVTVTVDRNGELISLPLILESVSEPQQDGTMKTVGRLGVTLRMPVRKVGFGESVKIAGSNTVYLITHMLDFFGRLVTGRMSPKLLGGPVMIAQLAGDTARSGFADLMGFTAFISINLGVLNLMPFPVLDGGHIFILAIESVSRRRLSDRFKLALQQFGTLVLLLLMLYITFNDVMRFDAISRLFGGG